MASKRKFQELEVLLTLRDKTRQKLASTLKNIKSISKHAAGLSKSIGAIGAVSGAGFAVAARQAGKYGLEIQNLSSQLNLSTDRFQEFLQVAKLAKPSTEAADLADSFKDIVERITEARTLGEGDLFNVAQAVGLNLELTQSNEIIEDFIANMRNLSREEGLQRVRELAGDSAFEEMFSFLQLSNDEFRELAGTAKDLGLIIKPETINNLAAMERGLNIVKTIMTTIAVETVGKYAKSISNAAITFAAFVKANGGALPILEKVWQRITEKVNGFLLSLNEIPGVDINLFGDAAQQQIAQYDHKLSGLKDKYKEITEFESRFTIQALKNRRLKKIQEEIDKTQELRDAMGDLAVPAAAPFSPALQEDIDNYTKLVEQTLKQQAAVQVPVQVKPVVKQAQEVQQVVKESIAPPAKQGAAEAGIEAAKSFADAFQERMSAVQETIGAVQGIFSGIEDLLSANEQKSIDRLDRLRSRNAAELDILKSRLATHEGLSRSEVAMHNQRAAAIAKNNSKLDSIAAAAEAKACKRAKKFAILQGALSVASAWAGAAKAAAAVAGAGPGAYFAAYAPVLSAGLAAAANVAKFNCNTIPSTSGGGAGGAAGGNTGPAFNPTTRQGADLPSDLEGRRQQPTVVNITLGANVDIADVVAQINDGDAQINVDRVAGVY